MAPTILVTTWATCLLIAGGVSAQAALNWKFTKGRSFDAERNAVQEQVVEFNGKQFKTESQSVWNVRFEVTGVQPDFATIRATFTKVEHKIVGASEAEWIDAKLHEKMQGSVFELDVAPSGRIVAMRGYGAFVKRLAGKDEARAAAVRVTLPEMAVKNMLEDFFGPLPTMRVAKGDGWRREYAEPIPHFGKLRSTASYRYTGKVDGHERIDFTIATQYELPAKDDKMTLFRIVKGKIDSDDAKGWLTFDPLAGTLVEHERTMRLLGVLSMESMGRAQELRFTSENSVKIRIKR
ncbi:MAG: hypothetical protein HYR84_08225 [Planctomycetes bacterium]|nr:hypothetical protein [Planctomycetota bacterium]